MATKSIQKSASEIASECSGFADHVEAAQETVSYLADLFYAMRNEELPNRENLASLGNFVGHQCIGMLEGIKRDLRKIETATGETA